MSHSCPVTGCETVVSDHLLMCRPHWFMVPLPWRNAVWDAYRGGEGIGTERLWHAQQGAIDAVNHKIETGGTR